MLVRRDDLVITTSWDETIRMWSVTSGTCLLTLRGHTEGTQCELMLKAPITLEGNGGLTLKTHPHTMLEEFKTQQSSLIFHLCWIKTGAGVYHDYGNVIGYENSFSFPSALKQKTGVFSFHGLRDGLVWTEDLTE